MDMINVTEALAVHVVSSYRTDVGLVVAFVLMQRSEILVYRLYFPLRATDMSDFSEYVAAMPVTALLLVLSCQLMGTLAGTFAAAGVGRSAVPGYVVGAFVLAAAVANAFFFQKPLWFSAASFVICIVMTLAGTRIGFSREQKVCPPSVCLRRTEPHPLFRSYVAAALAYRRSMKTTMVMSAAQKETEMV